MQTKPPLVAIEPRRDVCRAHVGWDGDSLVLAVSLSLADGGGTHAPTRSYASDIDRRLGIHAPKPRVVLGELDVLLDAGHRVTSMEIRTNPEGWQRAALPVIPGEIEPVFLSIRGDYDENGIASFDLPVRITYDSSQRQLSFAFGGYASSRWAQVADRLVVGLTLDNYLSELRLLNFESPRVARRGS